MVVGYELTPRFCFTDKCLSLFYNLDLDFVSVRIIERDIAAQLPYSSISPL